MRHQKTLRPNEIVLDDRDSTLLALARLSVLQFDSLREACAHELWHNHYKTVSREVGLFFSAQAQIFVCSFAQKSQN